MAKLIHQYKITLLGPQPPIWRRIQVPAAYSFWDLHVAIQDAMGWLDCHLHCFSPMRKGQPNPRHRIGIPDDLENDTQAGWQIPIGFHFETPGKTMHYEYDFGDGWEHEVLLEGVLLREKGTKYPRCLDGARACPPEDCGGTPGYEELLTVLARGKGEAYEEMIYWLGWHPGKYHPYDPEAFDPASVRFSSPGRRWNRAFAHG